MKKIKNKKIILIAAIAIVIISCLPFLINKTLGAIYNVEDSFTTDDNNVVINYNDESLYSTINFDVSLKGNNSYQYYIAVSFRPTGIEKVLEAGNYILKLEKSTDNSTFTLVDSKIVNSTVLNTDLVFIDNDNLSATKTYYKLSLYAETAIQDIRLTNISGNFKVKVYTDEIEVIGNTTNYGYTGAYQGFTAPKDGQYIIELWGASGAPFGYSPSGVGGYTKGKTDLKQGELLYFYVGGQGEPDSWSTSNCKGGAGGWNGGGSGGRSADSCVISAPGAGGGGATDVRCFYDTETKRCTTIESSNVAWNNALGLNSRIMVAGGGGVRTTTYNSVNYKGSAGGLVGYSHPNTSAGNGGSQIAGGSAGSFVYCGYITESGEIGTFGIGGGGNWGGPVDCGTGTGSWLIHAGDGGGGGYYGGGGGAATASGGGSSYISGHQGSIAIASSTSRTARNDSTGTLCTVASAKTDKTCSEHYSEKVFSESIMIDGEGYSWNTDVGASAVIPTPTTNYTTGYGHARISEISYVTSNVEYRWTKDPIKATLTVNYKTENNQTLKASDISEELVDESYTTSAPTSFTNFDNYELTKTPTNATGIMDEDGVTVDYIYRLKSGNVIVHHYLEGSTTSIEGATDQILTGPVTTSYTTSAMDIEKYELVNNPSNKTGTFDLNIQVVTYYYKLRETTSINVIHKLENNTVLDSSTISGYVGRPYTTSTNTYDNYVVKTVPSNANGTLAATNPDVIYIYELKPGGNVTVYHYIENTTTTIDGGETQILTGKYTENYTTNPFDINKYELVSTPNNATGTFTLEPQTVTYYYRLRTPASVNVIHRLVDTDEILNSYKIDGYVDDAYETDSKTFPNTTLLTTPANADGTLKTENADVIYTYTLNAGGNIIVHHYLDGTTVTIDGASDQLLSGKITMPYTTSPMNIEKYELVNNPSNKTGVYTSVIQEVTYYYRLRERASVDVVHKLDSGEILDTAQVSGYIGNPYTTTSNDYDEEGYILKTTPTNANGILKAENTDVIYIYTIMQGGVVTVHHYLEGTTTTIDATGAEDQNLTGKLGENYTTSAVTSSDYVLVSTPTNSSGVFTRETQNVTYYYRLKDPANVTVIYKSTEDSVLDRDDLVDKEGTPYTTEEKDFDNYELVSTPDNATGTFTEESQEVIYIYELKPGGNVTVHHYLNGTTTQISDDVILTGKVTKPYTTSRVNIENYTLVSTPDNAVGTFTLSPQTIIYYYTEKTPAKIEIIYQDEDGNILESDEKPGYVGDEYTTEEKEFDDYELINVTDNWHGEYSEETGKIIYTYNKVVNPKTGINNNIFIIVGFAVFAIFAYLYASKKQVFNI